MEIYHWSKPIYSQRPEYWSKGHKIAPIRLFEKWFVPSPSWPWSATACPYYSTNLKPANLKKKHFKNFQKVFEKISKVFKWLYFLKKVFVLSLAPHVSAFSASVDPSQVQKSD